MIVSSLLLALVMAGSLVAAEKKPAKSAEPTPPCCREPLAPGKYSERSVYTLGDPWTSDLGKTVKLDVLRGRPVVLALFFAKCEHSCPLVLQDMKEIEKQLPKNVRGKTDFLLVSIDPKHDTVEALQAYREKNKLPVDRWVLLRGDQASIDALAQHIGFKYARGSEYQFGHSLLITILNPNGDIVFQQAGVGVDRAEAVKTIEKLLATKRTN